MSDLCKLEPYGDGRGHGVMLKLDEKKIRKGTPIGLPYQGSKKKVAKNIVLLSSYTVSDARFEEVFRFETARSTLSGGKGKGHCEKLFMVKGGHDESHGS